MIYEKMVYLQQNGIQSQHISINTIGLMATKIVEGSSRSHPKPTTDYRIYLEDPKDLFLIQNRLNHLNQYTFSKNFN